MPRTNLSKTRDTRGFLVVGIVVLLLMAGGLMFSHADGPQGVLGGDTSETPSKTVAPPVFPLLGSLAPDAAAANRAAVVVKIDNAPAALPQYGIDAADIVIEERVEGGLTRFMAIFQSEDASEVGPVRSLRSSDIQALQPLGGVAFGYSGGIDPFKAMMGEGHLVDLSADKYPAIYHRKAGRPHVHSLTTSVTALREVAPKNINAPKPLFSYLRTGEHFAPSGAVPLERSQLRVSNALNHVWAYDVGSGLWRLETNGAKHQTTNGQIAVTNVVIQAVEYHATPYKDPTRAPVDEAKTVGSGEAWVLSGGKMVAARWNRPDGESATTYTTMDGQPISLQQGKTWLTLTPAGTTPTS